MYPILTVVAAAKTLWSQTATDEPLEFLYVGTSEGVEAKLARRMDLDFAAIQAGQIRIHNPIKLARNALRMFQGSRQARQLLDGWRPDAVFVTGGYVCGPVVWAAKRRQIPVLIYLPDITPGIGIKRMAPFASAIAVSFPEVASHFQAHTVQIYDTGYPVRAALRQRSMSRPEARTAMNLDPNLFTLLVFGGSRGARAINQTLAAILPQLLDEMQVIHISGELDYEQAQARTPQLRPKQRSRYHLHPYLHEDMIAALHAADLVVARAGASTLGEFPAMALPAILVPLPISGGHQRHNAQYLTQRGAAVIVENDALAQELLPTILDLRHDSDKLIAMSRHSAALARPQAAQDIAQILLNLTDNDHEWTRN